MKKYQKIVLALFAILSFTVFSCEILPDPCGDECTYQYLDLTKDPVNPEGISPDLDKELLQQGYQKVPLPEDVKVYNLEFMRKDGTLYYKDGYLPAGTIVYTKMDLSQIDYNRIFEGEPVYVSVCSNVYSHWRWQVRAGG